MEHLETLLDLVELFPGRGAQPALVHRTDVRRLVYSYTDLHERIGRMNRFLEGLGVGKGDRVVLWGANSPSWVVTFFGILCRGAVVVPVDLASGRERAATVAELTSPRLVIRSLSRPSLGSAWEELMLEEVQRLTSGLEPLWELPRLSSSHLAEIVYTSGTTGNPKGVMLTHGNLTANLNQVHGHLPVVAPDFSFLSLLPLSHMFEQTAGLLTPLASGASIIYLKTLKPSAIMSSLSEEDVQAVIAVPRLLLLLRNSLEERFRRMKLSGPFRFLLSASAPWPDLARRVLWLPVRRRFGHRFRFFISGGAPLSTDLFAFWRTLGFTVIEGYGLTECSPVLAANTLERQEAGFVGIHLPGVELSLREGELLARGDNVFPGYYGNPDATKEVFTDDGWFRTGDLAEMDEGGWVRIKGRSREMLVTAAGINVYPEEIEDLLNRVPGVRDSCVVGLDRGSGDEVHGILLLAPGVSAPEVVAAVNANLDELHRITGYTVWQEDDFPRTTTLKIRKFMVKEALQAGLSSGAVAGGQQVDRLAAVVARVAKVPATQVSDEALLESDLGLSSIGRLELVTALEEEFRTDLDESTMGSATRVADMRRMVSLRGGVGASLPFRLWASSPLLVPLRRFWRLFIQGPLLRTVVTLRVEGLDNLEPLEPPFIFIANHLSYLDQPCLLAALPPHIANHTATAAWAEFFFPVGRSLPYRLVKRCAFEACSLLAHVFPLPQSAGFRDSLRHMGRLVDLGENILIFPEGERSPRGGLLPFKAGLAVMVEELGRPLVPLAMDGLEKVLPRGAHWPVPGVVTVRIGTPLFFTGESRQELVRTAENAVAGLLKRGELS
jgi:long-chain acyl-CoA synthetase